MSTPIKICKEFLESEYVRNLFLEFGTFESKTKIVENQPIWQWVDRDLNPLFEAEAANPENGLILDPEIGICLYILNLYPNETDVAGQIIRSLEIRSKLLPEVHEADSENDKLDKHGSWRVILHWLVENEEIFIKYWLPEITRMRMETAHFE